MEYDCYGKGKYRRCKIVEDSKTPIITILLNLKPLVVHTDLLVPFSEALDNTTLPDPDLKRLRLAAKVNGCDFDKIDWEKLEQSRPRKHHRKDHFAAQRVRFATKYDRIGPAPMDPIHSAPASSTLNIPARLNWRSVEPSNVEQFKGHEVLYMWRQKGLYVPMTLSHANDENGVTLRFRELDRAKWKLQQEFIRFAPYKRLLPYDPNKSYTPYPAMFDELPKLNEPVMVKMGRRRSFESGILRQLDDTMCLVEMDGKVHKFPIARLYQLMPAFCEHNPLTKADEAEEEMKQQQNKHDKPMDSSLDKLDELMFHVLAPSNEYSFQDDRDRDPHPSTYYVPLDPEENEARESPENAAIVASLMNHPALRRNDPQFQRAMAHMVESKQSLPDMLMHVKPSMVNGRKQVDSAEFKVPHRVAKIDLVRPFAAAKRVDATCDEGADIDAIGLETALRHKNHIVKDKVGVSVMTGNGLYHTKEYLPGTIRSGDWQIATKFWVVNTLPWDWMIGRKTQAALSVLPTLEWQHFSWSPPPIDDVENELEALNEINPMDPADYLPNHDIDLSKITCGRPEMKGRIKEMLQSYKEVIALGECDSGLIPDTEYAIDWAEHLEVDPDKDGIVKTPYHCKPGMHEEYGRQFLEMWRQDVVEESTSQFAWPYFGVWKKTGDLRICFDFSALNALNK